MDRVAGFMSVGGGISRAADRADRRHTARGGGWVKVWASWAGITFPNPGFLNLLRQNGKRVAFATRGKRLSRRSSGNAIVIAIAHLVSEAGVSQRTADMAKEGVLARP